MVSGAWWWQSYAASVPAATSKVLSGVDHFWQGAEERLVSAVEEWMRSIYPSDAGSRL